MQVLRQLQRRVMGMVGRCVITAIDDERLVQSIQISALPGETLDDIERFQEYGFTSHPHPGAEAVAVFVQGGRDHGIIIAVDDRRYRLKALEQGEVALYTDEGDSIVMHRDRLIEVTTETLRVNAGTEVEINTPKYTLNAENTADINTAALTVAASATIDVSTTEYTTVATGSTTLTTPTYEVNASTQVKFTTPVLYTTDAMRVGLNITWRFGTGQQTDVDTLRFTYNTHTHQDGDNQTTSSPNSQV